MRLSFQLCCFCALLFTGSQPGSAAPSTLSGRSPETIFRPFRGDQATLSPSGSSFAYISHDERRLTVVLRSPVSTEPPVKIAVDEVPGTLVETLIWLNPDELLVVTETPALHLVEVAAKKSTRVLDAQSFAAPAPAGLAVPRPPRWIGRVPGEPDCVWVEGITRAQEQSAAETGFDDAGLSSDASSAFPSTSGLDGDTADTSAGSDLSIPEIPVSRYERTIELAKLNLRTRQWTVASTVTDQQDSQLLYDRQGHARLKYVRGAKRQEFLFHPEKSSVFRRWPTLDRWLGPEAKLAFQVTPQNYAGQRSFPLGFGDDPNLLYFASNVGRDAYALCTLDLRSKERREIAPAPARFDLIDARRPLSADALIFDRRDRRLVGVRFDADQPQIHWLDPELAAVQTSAQSRFTSRTVQLVDWNDDRTRFLLLVAAENDPGRYFVFQRENQRCIECLRRAPWLDPSLANPAERFDLVTAKGIRVAGRLTRPKSTLLNPPPVVVWCHDGPWERFPTGYSREAQALADLGCLVLQVDYRGSLGLGLHQSEALDRQFDQRPIDDVLAALDWLAPRHSYDPRRVVIVGEGFGGYLALRALQLQPQRFRAAIAINGADRLDYLTEEPAAVREAAAQRSFAQMAAATQSLSSATNTSRPPALPPLEEPTLPTFDLELRRAVFFRPNAPERGAPVLASAAPLQRPVLLLHDPESPTVSIDHVQALRKALKRRGDRVDFAEIAPGFALGQLPARARAFEDINDFLIDVLYRFEVKIGDPTQRPSP